MDSKPETKKALAAKAADAQKAVALKAAGLSANATAAEVVRLFKSTAVDVEKLTREGMRKLAELAALLVEGYGLTQEQVAEKVGRSQPWVMASCGGGVTATRKLPSDLKPGRLRNY